MSSNRLSTQPSAPASGRDSILKRRVWLTVLLGCGALLTYWLIVKPTHTGPGYLEDFCYDLSRRIMADNLDRYGRPVFESDLVMAPFGTPVPFFSWSIERDWMGAWFWKLDRLFPFIWVYFAASLALSYAGVGYILGKMGISKAWAWGLAAFFVLVHIPRHFKVWYHMEYLSQHWVFLSIFLDAWIWQRFARQRSWSWSLELWRSFLLIAVLGTPGYFWGPMALEWVVLRLCMLVILPVWWQREKAASSSENPPRPPVRVEGTWRQASIPIVLSVVWLTFELRWFLPLWTEMKKMGTIHQPIHWWANPLHVIRPVWLDRLAELFHWRLPYPRIDSPETVVSMGWLYLIPVVIAAVLLGKRRGGPGLKAVFPFVVLIILAICYFGFGPFSLIHWPIQTLIPFMSFFRVASRWGQFLPHFAAAIIVLSWPELSKWFRASWAKRSPRFTAALAAFLVMGTVEASWLLYPVLMQAPLSTESVQLLEHVRNLPGTTVLDLPFCVAGGNGVCTAQQCPQYPESTVGSCLSNWHDKKTYGLYQSRMTEVQCQLYNRAPYNSWFSAWGAQRCFTPAEWDEFCAHLEAHPEISTVFVYPDIWRALREPACWAEFEKRLGPPVESSVFLSKATRGGGGSTPSRLVRFNPACKR